MKRIFENITPYLAGSFCCEQKTLGSSFVNLALGENPYGFSPNVKKKLAEEISNISSYPDSSSYELREVISDFYDLSSDMVLVSNGIDELILLCALSLIRSGNTGICTESTFFGFEAAFEISGCRTLKLPLRDNCLPVDLILDSINENVDAIFICNPHNPTGTIISEESLEKIIVHAEKSNVVVVVDEAYAEYAEKSQYCTALKYLRGSRSLIVLRTFSKIYGLAGLRCGYALGSHKLIEQISHIRNVLPFNVNRLAQSAACEALIDQDFVEHTYQMNLKSKSFIYKALQDIGLQYIESQANFVLVKLPFSSKKACDYIKAEYGLILRDATKMGYENHIRVTLGAVEDIRKVISGLSNLL